jgi:hypothetical protein
MRLATETGLLRLSRTEPDPPTVWYPLPSGQEVDEPILITRNRVLPVVDQQQLVCLTSDPPSGRGWIERNLPELGKRGRTSTARSTIRAAGGTRSRFLFPFALLGGHSGSGVSPITVPQRQ